MRSWRGIRGDRYFDFKDNYKGQITFFSLEVFDALCGALELHDCSPRCPRNVMTREVDLNDLIGQDFEIQRVHFHGTQECSPCYWMDQAIAPGARILKGRGGLRARMVTSGKCILPRLTVILSGAKDLTYEVCDTL